MEGARKIRVYNIMDRKFEEKRPFDKSRWM
jgi:hypothetical protein